MENSSFLRIVKPTFDLKVIAATCSNGVSEFLSNISSAIMNTVFNGLLLYMIGQIGVSAYGSIGYINTIFTAIFMGYSIGVAPVISFKYGEGDTKELKSLFKKSMQILAVVSVMMTILAEALARPIAGVFAAGNADLIKVTVVGFVLILPIIFYIYYGPDTAMLGILWSVNYSEFFALLVTIFFLIRNRKKYQ